MRQLAHFVAVAALAWAPVRPLAGQTPVVELTEVACPECEITLSPVVTLGDPTGPGMLERDFNLVRIDSREDVSGLPV